MFAVYTNGCILHPSNNQKHLDMKSDMIYPELGQTTDSTIEYKCSYNGGFYITTDLELKGRGIKMSGDGSEHKRSKKTYHVTELAFNKLKEKHTTCFIASL